MADPATPSSPRWHTREQLPSATALWIGDRSEYAEDGRRGWWYFMAADERRWHGPYRSKRLAELARKRVSRG